MMRVLVLALLLLPLACTPLRPQLVERWGKPSSPRGDALAVTGWQSQGKTLLLRHAGYMQIEGKRSSLSGLILLDAGRRAAKLIVTGDFGITLFCMDITPEGGTILGPSPMIKRFPSLQDHIQRTVQALFLAPTPRLGDACLEEAGLTHLYGRRSEGWLTGTFDTITGDLLVKDFLGPKIRWKAEYKGYCLVEGLRLPELIRFTDLKVGFVVELHLLDAEIHTP